MRIAHVTATFPPYYGGTGNVCYHNARVLAERGHEVHVYTSTWPGEVDDPPGVTVHRLKPVIRAGNAPLSPQLGNLGRFDIIHLHYPFISGAEIVGLGAMLRRTPLVLTYHNDLRASGLRGRVFSLYERSAALASLRIARRVCVVSHAHAESSDLLNRVSRDRPSSIVELPNGVDTRIFHPNVDGRAMREKLGIPATATVAAFVGVLDTAHQFSKRVDLLIDAIATLDDQDLHLLIVGDGDMLSAYQRLANEMGIGDRTHFAGSVAHHNLPPYLAACDLLVLPSDVESFGLVLIEAMACQRPVVASDLPGVRTVITDGVDGLLSEPGNARDVATKIQILVDNPDQRRMMGIQGRTTVEKRFAWTTIADRLEEIYEDVLSSPQPQPIEKNGRVPS